MSDWRATTAAARRAATLLLRDSSAGEAEFARLLARYPNDGMVLLERGRARLAAGDLQSARSDIEAAIRYLPLERYKEQARRDLARLPGATQEQSPLGQIPPFDGVRVPSQGDLERAHAIFLAREPRAVDFDVAVRLLDQALAGPHQLSPTVPTAMLLQSWNFAYYQDGRVFDRAHFERLDTVLKGQRGDLLKHRRRALDDLRVADDQTVMALFRQLQDVVGRVGAAKVLHLWAPQFFPLWDSPIAKAYGFDLANPPEQYWHYMHLVREQLRRLVSPAGLSPLKALDEYNYCVFTKGWIPDESQVL